MEKFIINRDDTIYQAWPDVTLTPSGKLVAVWSECTHHGDRSYTNIVVAHSLDRGRSWTGKRAVTEPLHKKSEQDPHWNCARIMTLPDARLLIVMDRIAGEGEGSLAGEQSNWFFFSQDEGETWGPPVPTPMRGIVPDKLLIAQNGPWARRWFLSSHTVSEEVWAQRTWLSDDAGQSWQGPYLVASVPGLKLCEGTLFELPEGEICCLMRENSATGLNAYKSVSRDGGLTWDGPTPFALPGCHRPVAGMLHSGNILVTHRFCQGGLGWTGWWTQNFFGAFTDVQSCLATSHGQTHTRIFPLDFDRSSASDTGYSGWVQFPDGEIYVVNYIVDDAPKGHIRGYAFREEEFLIPLV